MKKNGSGLILAAVLVAGFALGAFAQESAPKKAPWVLKMRLLEAFRETREAAPTAVTSSYLKHSVSATIESDNDLAQELTQVQKTFNYKDVRLLTEADFAWVDNNKEKTPHVIRLDGKEFIVEVMPVDTVKLPTFRLQIYELDPKKYTPSLLNTEFSIPVRNIAVFGFEDSKGGIYFLSFRISGVSGTPSGEVEFRPESKSRPDVQGEGPVKATGAIPPPKLLKQVNPVYPEEARKAGVEGIVILEATMDAEGRVSNTRVLRSIPLLDQAAIDAVKQWVYEPLLIDGKSRGVIFTVTLRFALDGKKREGGVGGGQGTPESAPPPKLIKKTDPVYPEAARKARIEGIVILEVQTDQDGRVQKTKVLRSIPELDQAAVDAVKQWVYEPVIINGKPKPSVFTVTVRFALK